jgi:hypothetical protein
VAQFKRVDDMLADDLAQAVPAERLPPVLGQNHIFRYQP